MSSGPNLLTHAELKVKQLGSPALREPAQPVPDSLYGTEELRRLIEILCETMAHAPGVGLAAPQVGLPYRIVVLEDKEGYFNKPDRYSLSLIEKLGRKALPLQVLINPVLFPTEGEKVCFFEGCLSVPGFQAIVPRFGSVHVAAFSPEGEPQEIDAVGWHARILQHEIDHLDGKLYIDWMIPATFMSTEYDQRYWTPETRERFFDLFNSSSESRKNLDDIQRAELSWALLKQEFVRVGQSALSEIPHLLEKHTEDILKRVAH